MSKIKLGAWGLGLALTLGAAPGVMAQQAPAKPNPHAPSFIFDIATLLLKGYQK